MGEGGGTVLKAVLDDGSSILGLRVAPEHISSTLRNLGAMKGNTAASKEDVQAAATSEDIFSGVLQSDTLYVLANGWKLKRARVLGENRLELVGPDFISDKWVQKIGIRKERIGGQEPRYFIPTGHPAVLDMLIRYSPVARTVDKKGNESYRLSPAAQRDAALKHEILFGKPVATLTGNEFLKEPGVSLLDRVVEYYRREYGGEVTRPGVGRILLSKGGVKSDIMHGVGRTKAASFAAIPEIIAKGKVLRIDPNWKGRGYRSFVIGAPVEIAEKRYSALVGVTDRENKDAG